MFLWATDLLVLAHAHKRAANRACRCIGVNDNGDRPLHMRSCLNDILF